MSKQPKLQNDQGKTTLGALPSNVDRGRNGSAVPHDKNLFGVAQDRHGSMKGLKREFTFPPFSVFNTRDGLWQARKRLWLKLGIESEVGRGENAVAPSGSLMPAADYSKGERGDGKGPPLPVPAFDGKKTRAFGMGMAANAENGWQQEDNHGSGVSIFDPVLCELAYSWFCPPDGQILDPFAGGSVRGIVAACMGRKYFGMDLSGRQIEANRIQAAKICRECDFQPEWAIGDSTKVRGTVPAGFAADCVFSCPPYADLEVYSNDPRDISAMPYEGFLEAYRRIIRRATSLLKQDRFAVWVVGDVRNTKVPGSPYHGFVLDTINAFRDAGLAFYNEAILVTAVGSLPLRVRKQFHSSRKLGRTHQNILVFVKGDPKAAAAANPLKAMAEAVDGDNE